MQFDPEKNNILNTNKLNQKVKQSWDINVAVRASDLEEETDYSYIHIIKPWVIKKIINKTTEDSTIVDAGCGCGYLTNAIYVNGRKKISGIDISTVSIEYAKNKYPHINFICDDICTIKTEKTANMCLAVMLMNYIPDLQRFFANVRGILLPGGSIITIIPHPCFWPARHICDKNFSYGKEAAYPYKFVTKGRSDYNSEVVYFHRNLETYLFYAQQENFQLTNLEELFEGNYNQNPDILCLEFKLT